jgi:hypothetical protein
MFRRGRRKMRRVTLLVTAIGVAMLLASGVDLAATFDGTPGPDTFVGTDSVSAGAGDDVIEAHDDAGQDTIDCGDGIDTVDFDAGVDVVADNCENRDPH